MNLEQKAGPIIIKGRWQALSVVVFQTTVVKKNETSLNNIPVYNYISKNILFYVHALSIKYSLIHLKFKGNVCRIQTTTKHPIRIACIPMTRLCNMNNTLKKND